MKSIKGQSATADTSVSIGVSQNEDGCVDYDELCTTFFRAAVAAGCRPSWIADSMFTTGLELEAAMYEDEDEDEDEDEIEWSVWGESPEVETFDWPRSKPRLQCVWGCF